MATIFYYSIIPFSHIQFRTTDRLSEFQSAQHTNMTSTINIENTPNESSDSVTESDDVGVVDVAATPPPENQSEPATVEAKAETNAASETEINTESDNATANSGAEAHCAEDNSANQDHQSQPKLSQDEASKTLDHIQALLEQLNAALEDGQLKGCISLYEQCQARMKKLEDIDYKPKKFKAIRKELSGVHFEMQKLKKWRHWGTNQARIDLIETLKSLKDSEEHPRELHARIKEIRDQWNKWNKSGDFPSHKLRESFSEAHNEAFKPCKKYFKEQKKQRKQNKKLRKQVCVQLEELYDSINWKGHPDWKTISDSLRLAKKQWKSAVPLNKKDWDSTNARFDQIIGKFQPHLAKERETGVQFRLDLIDKANALDSEPIKVAIERAKVYQQSWKSVVIRTRKKKETELWEAFKNACDRQFERRNDIRRQKNKQRQDLLDEIKTINERPVSEIKESASKVSELQREWRKVGESKRNHRSALESGFDNEIAKFKTSVKQAGKLEMESLFSTLERKAEICNELECCQQSDDKTEILTQCQHKWDSIDESCGEFEEAIQKRFSEACAMVQNGSDSSSEFTAQASANFESKQDICLRLEVLSEIESPPEFTRQRMQYNVARLSAVMTKQSGQYDPKAETDQLMIQYWLTGAVPAEHNQLLQERFARIQTEVRKGADTSK